MIRSLSTRRNAARLLVVALAFAAGCSYGAMAVAPNGTVYVARNDNLLFGALRQVYACTPSGSTLNCAVAGAP